MILREAGDRRHRCFNKLLRYYYGANDPPFAGASPISKVGLYLDNTPGNGDVRLPDSPDIGGVSYNVVADASWGPRWLYFDVPNTTGAHPSVIADDLPVGETKPHDRYGIASIL